MKLMCTPTTTTMTLINKNITNLVRKFKTYDSVKVYILYMDCIWFVSMYNTDTIRWLHLHYMTISRAIAVGVDRAWDVCPCQHPLRTRMTFDVVWCVHCDVCCRCHSPFVHKLINTCLNRCISPWHILNVWSVICSNTTSFLRRVSTYIYTHDMWMYMHMCKQPTPHADAAVPLQPSSDLLAD